MAWQRFKVELKGEDAIEVQTNARDWANVSIDPGAPKALDMTFRVVHSALVRVGHSVPRDYVGFLEILDGIPTLDRRRRRRPSVPYGRGTLGRLAVTAAIRTGVAPEAWLEDPRALVTCAELLHEADQDAKRRR